MVNVAKRRARESQTRGKLADRPVKIVRTLSSSPPSSNGMRSPLSRVTSTTPEVEKVKSAAIEVADAIDEDVGTPHLTRISCLLMY